jgi:hypothetical protein
MVYTEDLEQLILGKHKKNGADELLILTGWSGASPIKKLSELESLKSTIIHGIKRGLNVPLLKKYIDISTTTKTTIYVSHTYNHSKIYCWIKQNTPVAILSGSANLSTEGLNNKNKGEVLFDLEPSDYLETYKYLQAILKNSDHSDKVVLGKKLAFPLAPVGGADQLDKVLSTVPPKAEIYLGGLGRKIQPQAGLNWGHGKGNNAKDTGYITLRAELIKAIPSLFPDNGVNFRKGKGQAHKNKKPNAEFLFDDGEVMDISFEGIGMPSTVDPDQKTFKQVTSFPEKNLFGRYFRKRLGLHSDAPVTDADVARYGRDTITLERISDGVYFCDFSVTNRNT